MVVLVVGVVVVLVVLVMMMVILLVMVRENEVLVSMERILRERHAFESQRLKYEEHRDSVTKQAMDM